MTKKENEASSAILFRISSVLPYGKKLKKKKLNENLKKWKKKHFILQNSTHKYF